MRRDPKKLSEILERVQHSIATHNKYIKTLENLYVELDFEEFCKQFIDCLMELFITNLRPRNLLVERSLEFCALFSVSVRDPVVDENTTMCSFIYKILNFLLEYVETGNKNVRYHVCMFITYLLNHMTEEIIDDMMYDDIRNAMIKRLEDLIPAVRIRALLALQRLQNPIEIDDPVIKEYLKMCVDHNVQARKSAIQCVALNVVAIPCVLQRCLDVDEGVRLTAYTKFSQYVKVLKVEHRQYLMKNGFKEKNKIHRYVTHTLLDEWLSYYDNDILRLMRALKLDADENELKQTLDIFDKVLTAFFSKKPIVQLIEVLSLGPDKVISYDDINLEIFVYWRSLVQFLHSQNDENDDVENIIPELTQFCNYIESFYNNRQLFQQDWELLNFDHVLLELVKMLHYFDFGDEVGRRALRKLIIDILTDTKVYYSVIEALVKVFEKLVRNEEELTNEICYIVSEIREPLTVSIPVGQPSKELQVEVADLKVQYLILTDEQERAVVNLDFELAQKLKIKIADVKNQMNELTSTSSAATQERVTRNDPATLCKCLDILLAALQLQTVKTVSPALRTLNDEFVKPLLCSNLPDILPRALHYFAICVLLDKSVANDDRLRRTFYGPLITYRYLANYLCEHTLVAISACVDLMIVNGIDFFGESSNTSRNRSRMRQLYDRSLIDNVTNLPASLGSNDIVEILCEMLDDDVPEIRNKAGEGLVKLMESGTLNSPVLLTRLILKWFNPATGRDVYLRQMLGGMFHCYASLATSADTIEQAFLPTLDAVAHAPRNTPLADLDMDSVLHFMVYLAQAAQHTHNQGLDTHKNIAFLLCKEICNKPDSKCTQLFLKSLLMLDPPLDDEMALTELRQYAEKMLELLKDKNQFIKYVVKYKNKLAGNLEQTASTIRFSTQSSTTNSQGITDANSLPNVTNENGGSRISLANSELKRESISSNSSRNTGMDFALKSAITSTHGNRLNCSNSEVSSTNDTNKKGPRMSCASNFVTCQTNDTNKRSTIPSPLEESFISDTNRRRRLSLASNAEISPTDTNRRSTRAASRSNSEVNLTSDTNKKKPRMSCASGFSICQTNNTNGRSTRSSRSSSSSSTTSNDIPIVKLHRLPSDMISNATHSKNNNKQNSSRCNSLPVKVKRKKGNRHSMESEDSTLLHTIVEETFEGPAIDNNLNDTTDSSQAKSVTTVLSETDSDDSQATGSNRRRSKRKR